MENLRDWRGEATILPPRLKYEIQSALNGPIRCSWCDIPVTRVWRCGNRGSVASVLIEKPACGNFLPILDGGFSLQYSPLMEYREGKGMVLFCQMDVTGRTEADPAAERLVRNIVDLRVRLGNRPRSGRPCTWAIRPARPIWRKPAYRPGSYEGGKLSADQVLIVGPGAGTSLPPMPRPIGDVAQGRRTPAGHRTRSGGRQPLLVPSVTMKKAEHIAAYFEPFGRPRRWRASGRRTCITAIRRISRLIAGGAAVVGDGMLATADSGNVVFCQLVPWQCDYSKEQHNVKQTFRRTSFLVTRLLGNMGVEGSTPVLARFSSPVRGAKAEKRWLDGLYLDQPEEWDNPYRFFRWWKKVRHRTARSCCAAHVPTLGVGTWAGVPPTAACRVPTSDTADGLSTGIPNTFAPLSLTPVLTADRLAPFVSWRSCRAGRAAVFATSARIAENYYK